MIADMSGAPPDQLDVMLVVTSDALALRIKTVLEAWGVGTARVTEAEALERVELGASHVVVVERQDSIRLYLERVRAAGGTPLVVGKDGVAAGADVGFAAGPSSLLGAIFRAQGRMANVEAASLDRINRFSQVIATQFTLPALMQVAIAKTRELCDADGASLLLVDPVTGELYFDTIDGGASSSMERVRLSRGRGIAGKVAVEARARLVTNVRECPDFEPAVDRRSGFTTGSVVAAPLVVGGDILGVLMAVRSIDSAPFMALHLERLTQLAPHVAIAVHNAQITSALRAAQSETLQANASLEQKVRERTAQISRAKQEWERTFDVLAEPIALMDGFLIRRANQAYARQVKLPVKELPGKTCHKVLAGRDSPCPGCPLIKGRGATLSTELEMPDATGARPVMLRFNGYWMSDDPHDTSIVVHYQDVTQSKHLAERLRESERLAAVGQLASGAAHEINNPLGFVTSNLRSLRSVVDDARAEVRTLSDAVQLAKDKRLDELIAMLGSAAAPDQEGIDEGLAMIDESLDGARRVGDIVKGLRELSRLEIGKREPAIVNASVTRIVRAVFGENADQVTVALDADSPADIGPLQLDQALGHVLKNAHQATPDRQRVAIRTWCQGNEVVLQVRDEGAGIAKENVRRVFEPFFTTRGVGKGIGLGLTAAYGIVKRAGGEIEVESEGAGLGSTFTIKLPRVDSVAFIVAA